jgi:hypothetical protein
MSDFGRAVIRIFEIDRVRCSLVFSESPCSGELGVTGVRKCTNARSNCHDPAAFTPEIVVDRHLPDQEGTLHLYAPFVPSIEDMAVKRPLSINLAGMDKNAAALGTRETLSVTFRDHLHSDLGHDDYRLERYSGDASLHHSGTADPDSNTGEMTDFLVLAQDAPTKMPRDAVLRLVGGTASGQQRRILSYDPATRIARVESAWDSGPAPDETTEYELREAYDPYKRGSYWGKWIARNPFHSAYSCRAYWGYLGDPIESMRVGHYIIDRVEGPVNGMVSLTAKDLFSKIEARKAVAPFPSRGELSADLTGTPSGFSVNPPGIGGTPEEEGGYASIDDSSGGYLAIGDEFVHVTRSGDDFTFVPDSEGLSRGCLGTEADDHEEDDLVQGTFSAVQELPHDIAYRLLTEFSKIDPAKIDKDVWDARAAEITDLYTGRVGKPTPVLQLIGELERQAGFTPWPDVSTGMIELRALRAGAVSPVVTDQGWIVDDSLSVKPEPQKRVSQVWVYYGMKNPMEDVDDDRNYHSRVLRPDVPTVIDLESETKYDVPAIEHVYSRWIPKGGRAPAERCGDRIAAMFQDPPLVGTFRLPASKDGELDYALYFELETSEVQDQTGQERPVTMATIEVSRGEFESSYRAQSVSFGLLEEDDGVRRVFIENDELNVTLRTLHDSHYPAPLGDELIEFIVVAGFSVGSSSTGAFSMDTGEWPAMTTPPRLVVLAAAHGEFELPESGIQGKGGKGGDARVVGGVYTAFPGEQGGPALKVRVPFTLDGNGRIWAGAGGGGAGGTGISPLALGGGGGGGLGVDGGSGGVGYNTGQPGDADNGGPGGNGNGVSSGRGGQGGGVLSALAGFSGQNGTGNVGAAGGAAGIAIDGVSLVTFDSNADLDILGSQIN